MFEHHHHHGLAEVGAGEVAWDLDLVEAGDGEVHIEERDFRC